MLYDALQIYLFLYLTYRVVKFAVKRKLRLGKKYWKDGKKKKSLLGKVLLLISRRLHSRLDGMLKRQLVSIRKQRSLAKQCGEVAQQDSKEKVIQFSKYQKKVVK